MKKRNVLIVVVMFSWLMVSFFQDCCFAQTLEFGSSPNPVGSGARALGMGGSFISIADDATAASWNPGGLIQLEKPEVSVVLSYVNRKEDNDFDDFPEASGNQDVSENDFNYISMAYPFTLFNRNMIVSLNYQHLYDFSRDWDFPFIYNIGTPLPGTYSHEQEGGLYATGLAYCIQITPTFSFGFTLNFWEDWLGDNEWERTTTSQGNDGAVFYERRRYDHYSFEGFNANIGMMWNITNKITIGAVLKTPFTADVEQKYSERRFLEDISIPFVFQDINDPLQKYDGEMDMPMSYGIGLSYRFSDEFTASADIYRTEWQDFMIKDEGGKTSPISGVDIKDSDVGATNQVRVGAEYLLIKDNYVIPLRGGLFYDPAPSEDGSDHFYGVSLGSGIAIGRFIFDMAYQYRFGNGVGSSMVQGANFEQDVDEHTVYSSLIFHF